MCFASPGRLHGLVWSENGGVHKGVSRRLGLRGWVKTRPWGLSTYQPMARPIRF